MQDAMEEPQSTHLLRTQWQFHINLNNDANNRSPQSQHSRHQHRVPINLHTDASHLESTSTSTLMPAMQKSINPNMDATNAEPSQLQH